MNTQKQKSKEVNGVELPWSEEYNGYVFPMPEPGRVDLVYNEQTETFEPAYEVNKRDDLRKAFVETYTQSAIDQKRLQVEAHRLHVRQMWNNLATYALPLTAIGALATVVGFVYNVISAMSGIAYLAGIAARNALAEMAYYGAWAAGLVSAAVGVVALIWLVATLLTRKSGSAAYDPMTAAQQPGANTIIIQQGNGTFGPQSPAQQYINNRFGQ